VAQGPEFITFVENAMGYPNPVFVHYRAVNP